MKQNEYLMTPCFLCGKKKLRRKLEGDWTPGEKLAKGFNEDKFLYYYCDACKRSSMQNKEEEAQKLVHVAHTAFLWWFL